MGLSDPRSYFGVHEFTPLRRTNGLPYGTIRALGEGSINVTGELVKLNAGSNKYPWHIEPGLNTAEVALTIREFSDFVYELFLGATTVASAAESGGGVTALANKLNASVFDASTGIASVGVKSGSETDLKFTKYTVICVTSTTIDVYAGSDLDFARGTDKVFEDDTLKITASPITIVASTAAEVPGFGVELTGGSGTIGMTVGDTATFEVRPINTGSSLITVGALTDVVPEFEALVYTQKRNNLMTEFNIFRMLGTGLPQQAAEQSWSEASVTAEAFFDSAKGGVYALRVQDV